MDRSLLFGNAAGQPGAMRGVFSPQVGAGREKGSVLSTFRGWDLKGKGQDQMLGLFEKAHLITSEQRAAGGPVGEAAQGAVEATADAGFTTGAGTAAAGNAVGTAATRGGLYEQMLAQRGFAFPLQAGAAEEMRIEEAAEVPTAEVLTKTADEVAEDIAKPATEAAEDGASKVATLEQQFIERLQQVAALPEDQHVSVLAKAIDLTAAEGLGDDARAVLTRELADRPLDRTIELMGKAIDSAAAPAVTETVEHVAAPVVDQAAKGAADVAPKLVEAAAPAVTEALHGLSFSAGLEATAKLLAHARL